MLGLKRLAARTKRPSEASRGRAASQLGALAAIMAGAWIAVWGAAGPDRSSLLALGFFVGSLCIGALMAALLLDLATWFSQRRRDLIAERVWRTLKAGGAPQPFCLYLRPFASTDEIDQSAAFATPLAAGDVTHIAIGDDRAELEAEIEWALRPIGPLVALGAPMEHQGAGRILVQDTEWRDAVRRLVDAARLIVLLPSSRMGTLWEVRQLLNGEALAKTLIIDPPNDHPEDSDRFKAAAEWDAVRAAFAADRSANGRFDLTDSSELWCLRWTVFDPAGKRREPVMPVTMLTWRFSPPPEDQRYPEAEVTIDYPKGPETLVRRGFY